MEQSRFEQMYQDGTPPWDHGFPDFNLADMVQRFSIQPCHTLDLGCGTGSNAIWLAQQGFDVLGFDLSSTAIVQAKEKAAKAGVSCGFKVGDFLTETVQGSPFGFVFDRGCFHCITEPGDRINFSARVASILGQGGLWLSLIGNADEPEREIGPPRMTAAEITTAVESHFEILFLASGVFGDKQDDPPRNWICLMKRRAT